MKTYQFRPLRNKMQWKKQWAMNIDPTPTMSYPKLKIADLKPNSYRIKLKTGEAPLRPFLIDFKPPEL